jgi:hypothetical protein
MMECDQVPRRAMGVRAVLREKAESGIKVNSASCVAEPLDALDEHHAMP